jgi:polysaccharide biosynthesis/export protein
MSYKYAIKQLHEIAWQVIHCVVSCKNQENSIFAPSDLQDQPRLYMNISKLSAPVILFILLVTSCIPNKKLLYLQDTGNESVIKNQEVKYLIQPGDLLSIRVHSLDPQISSFFNVEPPNAFTQNNPANLYVNGYSVSDSGTIKMPMLGALSVKNKTIKEIQAIVQEKINENLKNATVVVKQVNFRISVLGEVVRPGYFYVYNDRATILEALGMAGDLTAVGNRANIKVVRQTETGSEIIVMNLNNSDFLSSKGYFLQPGDVVYIESLKAKATRNNLQPFTVVFAGISAVVLILNFIINVNK